MAKARRESLEFDYPLRAVVRLTGLSPELLRAWERRHGVITPLRTPGGTRRYSASDLERLRLLKAAVDAGHRIGEIARLEPDELERRVSGHAPAAADLSAVLDAAARLDTAEAQRLLSLQLSALGPSQFARGVAVPLLREVGQRWADGRLGVAHEHLISGVLRSLLGTALQPTTGSRLGVRIVFATPSGERHELGLLMAAVTALGAGANAIYLGPDVPTDDLTAAVADTRADALALSLVCMTRAHATRAIESVRDALPSQVPLWIGGAAAREIDPTRGAEHLDTLDELERRVVLLGAAGAKIA